jgi:transposase InsO family protein
VQRSLAVSERRACRVFGQPRNSQRYAAKTSNETQRLVAAIHVLVRRHPRYGYRRIWAMLRLEGWRVNRKRVYRLWRQEGLKVPQNVHKKRRLGSTENGCVRKQASCPNEIWAWDFVHDRTSDGRPLKWFSIVDEYTRECLTLEVNRRMTSRDIVDILMELFLIRGTPSHLRSDNGPEFIAGPLRRWLARASVETLYIEPGSPWENGYAESFNARLRDELLNAEEFDSLRMAKVLATDWRLEYNHRRPHGALKYQTPAAFAAEARHRLGPQQSPLPPGCTNGYRCPTDAVPEKTENNEKALTGTGT